MSKTPAPGPIQAKVRSLLDALRAAGKPSAAAIYRRHGVKDDVLGVLRSDLDALARRVGVDHEVALGLWSTGVHEARLLATRTADTARLTSDQVTGWVAEVRDYVADDAVAHVAARLPEAQDLAMQWIRRGEEFVSAAGWTVVGLLAAQGRLAETEARRLLAQIVGGIHNAPNRTRYAMNNALISIGGYLETLREAALATARTIGPVHVDHGQTECKTPNATDYIAKMAARSRAPASRAGSRRTKAPAAKVKPASRRVAAPTSRRAPGAKARASRRSRG